MSDTFEIVKLIRLGNTENVGGKVGSFDDVEKDKMEDKEFIRIKPICGYIFRQGCGHV